MLIPNAMKYYLLQILLCVVLCASCKKGASSTTQDFAIKAHVEELEPNVKEIIKDWDGYWAPKRNIAMIENTNALNAIDFMDKMANNCNAMILQIPDAIETPEIKNRVEKVDTRINQFYTEVNRNEMRERIVQNHIETIVQAFDTLNKELNSTL